MLTNPSTLGLFDPNIEEIARIVHGVGATLYYDGANLNAVMGKTRPGDMGFDIVHFNLHKSFTQPHGGGGPGLRPDRGRRPHRAVPAAPQVVRVDGGNGDGPTFDLDFDRPKSIGRLRGFQGNFGVFVRSYAYILSLGGDGLTEASETAVLNANYLLARLKALVGDLLPVAYDRLCMHEFVLSGAPMKKQLGMRTIDLAKRLLDHGYHPPTVYFPLVVDEALMVEPTETETRETLDAFAEAIERDPRRGRGGSGDRPQRAVHDAGAPPRRGRRGQAAGHPPAAAAGAVGRCRCLPRWRIGDLGCCCASAWSVRSPLLALGVGIALQLRSNIREEAVDDARTLATLTARLVGSAGAEPERPRGPLDPTTSRRVTAGVRASLEDTHVVRVKLWNRDGLVVYSDDPESAGRGFPVGGDLREALEGHVGADVSSLDQAEEGDDALRPARRGLRAAALRRARAPAAPSRSTSRTRGRRPDRPGSSGHRCHGASGGCDLGPRCFGSSPTPSRRLAAHRGEPPAGPRGRAHRARQPQSFLELAGAALQREPALAAVTCCSTSTASRSSTTRSATTPATCCCARSARGCAPRCAERTRRAGSAATSSPRSLPSRGRRGGRGLARGLRRALAEPVDDRGHRRVRRGVASASRCIPSDGDDAARCCSAPTWRCTRPRRPRRRRRSTAGGRPVEPRAPGAAGRAARGDRRATSWSCTTSRRSTCRRARSSASRRSCAGSIRAAGCSARAVRRRSPSTPG